LRPHTHTAPKVLVQVAGKPMLGHILDDIVELGLTQVTFVIGYLGDRVRAYVESDYPLIEGQYVEQPEQLGLGHAIWLTRPTIGNLDEPVLIVLGDTIFRADLRPVLQSDVSMIGVREVDDPTRFGIVELENGFISRLVEKPRHPKTNLAIVGIYFLKAARGLFEALDEIIAKNERTSGEFQLTDALQRLLDRGERMRAFRVEEWYDCGKPETLLETNRRLLELKGMNVAEYGQRYPGCIINAPVCIDPNATIDNSIVGPHVSVAEGSVIRNSIVTDSILSSNASVVNMVLTGSIVSDKAIIEGESFRLNVGDSSEVRFGSAKK
jgi:glucose-1-phosphate thymidylyltransferase